MVAVALLSTLAGPVQADPLDVLDSPYDVEGHYDASTNSFVLTWQASPDAPSGTTYNVYRDSDLLGSIAATTFTDAAMPNAATWTYTITAQHGTTESSPAVLMVFDASWALTPWALPLPGQFMMGGPTSSSIEYKTRWGQLGGPCPLIAIGWGPNPPYLFGVDEDCLEEIIHP